MEVKNEQSLPQVEEQENFENLGEAQDRKAESEHKNEDVSKTLWFLELATSPFWWIFKTNLMTKILISVFGCCYPSIFNYFWPNLKHWGQGF